MEIVVGMKGKPQKMIIIGTEIRVERKVNPDDPEGQLKWRRVIQTAMIKSSAALYFIFPQIIIFFDISFGHILTSHFGKILHFIALKHKPKFCHKRTATEVEISDSENIFKYIKSANKKWEPKHTNQYMKNDKITNKNAHF